MLSFYLWTINVQFINPYITRTNGLLILFKDHCELRMIRTQRKKFDSNIHLTRSWSETFVYDHQRKVRSLVKFLE